MWPFIRHIASGTQPSSQSIDQVWCAGMRLLPLGLLAVMLCSAQPQSSAPSILSPGDELNAQLPSWFRFTGEDRVRLEGYQNLGFKPASSDTYLLNRFRFGWLIKPKAWLRIRAELQDARAFGKTSVAPAPPFQNTFDLRQAYVELGDLEAAPVAVRAGRQELNFGEERLIGSTNWTNNARVFDAIRITARWTKYRIDAFAASVVNPFDGGFDHHQPGNNLYGLYGSTKGLIPNATLEPYILWRVAPGQRTEAGVPAKLDEKITGVRLVGTLPMGFDYATEMVLQRGGIGGDNISAWAGHWLVGHTWKAARWTPRVYSEFNHASGDSNSKDGTRGTFDNLYPTNHDRYGLADQVAWKNINHIREAVDIKPTRKVGVIVKFEDWWLASKTDALYNAQSVVLARSLAGTAGTHVGEEIDITATYSPQKNYTFGAGFAHIFPGEFLKNTTPGKAYSTPYVLATYKF